MRHSFYSLLFIGSTVVYIHPPISVAKPQSQKPKLQTGSPPCTHSWPNCVRSQMYQCDSDALGSTSHKHCANDHHELKGLRFFFGRFWRKVTKLGKRKDLGNGFISLMQCEHAWTVKKWFLASNFYPQRGQHTGCGWIRNHPSRSSETNLQTCLQTLKASHPSLHGGLEWCFVPCSSAVMKATQWLQTNFLSVKLCFGRGCQSYS